MPESEKDNTIVRSIALWWQLLADSMPEGYIVFEGSKKPEGFSVSVVHTSFAATSVPHQPTPAVDCVCRVQQYYSGGLSAFLCLEKLIKLMSSCLSLKCWTSRLGLNVEVNEHDITTSRLRVKWRDVTCSSGT